MLIAKIWHFDFFCLKSLQPWKLHSHQTADEFPGLSHKFMQFLVAWWLNRNLFSLFSNEIIRMIRMKYKHTKLHRLEKHVGDSSHPWPSDPLIISCCHSGRSPSPQKILFKQLFVDTQFKLKSGGGGREEEEEAGGIATSLSRDAACNAYAFVRPFLRAAWVGEFILPWRSSKSEEQPAFLFWITDACTISEMKSLATELLSLPYFTHLAYSVCVLWKFTTSCTSAGFWGLYDRIVINCFVVLGGGHCIFSTTGSVLFFSHWFP